MAKKKLLFEVLDHCCRVCGGRLLAAETDLGSTLVRCSECTAQAETQAKAERLRAYLPLCFCGVRLASGADAQLRCRRVASPTPERPQEVVVLREDPKPTGAAAGGRRPVRAPGSDD